ncbi:MAG: response regulator [Dysgonamonadaceae bacterium]|jgi:ligand-binding sensor domain-containing protein/signal transduction histidine kinase/DNA-binding response OmpR family regulator|nr:response regulator [Dysgonamonadaceae bacterium]
MKKILVPFLALIAYLCSCERDKTSGIAETPREQKVSYLNIQSFCQDSLGYVWIATLHGLDRYNGYEFTQYFHNAADSSSINNDMVFSLYLDSSQRLWVGTLSGANRYDFKSNRFVRYNNIDNYASNVYSFFEDCSKNIWVATHSGPGLIDSVKRKVIFPSKDRCIVRSFWEDNFRRLWMGTNQGLAERQNDSLWNYYPLPDNRQVTSCVYIDPGGMWWAGTNAGLVCFDPRSRTFKKLPSALECPELSQSQINFIQETKQLKLLIGTETQGLFQYDILTQTLQQNEPWRINYFDSKELLACYVDRQENVWMGSYDKGFTVWNKSLEYFNDERPLGNMVKDKFVTRIAEDRYGNLWIATRYHGLFHYAKSGKITVYNAQNSDLFNGNTKQIEELFIDSKNRIWIGLAEQLIVGSISADGRIHLLAKKPIEQVRTMKEDPRGNLWIGSWYGLFKMENLDRVKTICSGNIPDLCILDSGDLLFSAYDNGLFRLAENDSVAQKITPSAEGMAVAQHCITLFEDSQQRVWMGSYGYGMLCRTGNDYRVFTKKDGLPNNNVLCFEEDRQGNLWMSTSNGLSKLNTTDSSFTNFYSSDGTLGNQYHEKGGLKHSDGRIFFTGNHGLTFFNPLAVLPEKGRPVVHLEDLKILGRSVQPEADDLVLPIAIAYIRNITLSHKQSNFSIDYAGIDFIAPDKLTYAYKMEGFDENWNNVGNFRRATYSNLPAGKYTFLVKAINGDGVESAQPAAVQITIKPAPWFSWWAWTLYITALLISSFFLSRLIIKVNINKHLLEIESKEKEREHEISEMKMKFFTNISHELRTPLTLISAPLEQLSSVGGLNEAGMRILDTASRNVQRMLRLISQLLDFNKMENGILELKVQHENSIQLIRSILEVYVSSIEKKRINFKFCPHKENVVLWMDVDKFEKILHNLLSNALKHTPEGGDISVTVNEISSFEADAQYQFTDKTGLNERYMEVTVENTGASIPENKLGELFQRYHQIEGLSGLNLDYGGSGIGLHYTKTLVETHKGCICAKPKQGGGMVFSFILPVEDVYDDTEKRNVPEEIVFEKQYELPPDDNPKTPKYCSILIVEDNIELLGFIRDLLHSHYELFEAMDGDKAWALVQDKQPDLILSDVLIPGMSGYELCANVKKHPDFSHIPVILLTAKTTLPDQLKGLEEGADAYICKPFNVDYLLLTIKNLFLTRDRLRQWYLTPKSKTQDEKSISVSLSIHDEKMMNKLTLLLEKELSNPDLNVDYLGRDLGFSRTSFYRKMKGLMNLSPNEFLINYRLRKAAEMLQDENLSLSEISDKTGFSSYSYFSKSFKKYFGATPKDYRKTKTGK